MGLFDKIRNAMKTPLKTDDPTTETKSVDSTKIDAERIDQMQREPASASYRNLVHRLYYKKYPELPFISRDREENADWLEQAKKFPKQSIIPVEIMTRFDDGLLPGHIYMLYWLETSKRKRIPSYFEYKYGIDFIREKDFLVSKGYVFDDKPTEKGLEAIKKHQQVIDAHLPERTSEKLAQKKYEAENTISIRQKRREKGFLLTEVQEVNGRPLMIVSSEDREAVLEDLKLVNSLVKKINEELGLSDKFIVRPKSMVFNGTFDGKLYTYFEYSPTTKTGKKAKYPIILHFASNKHYGAVSDYDCFGHLSYLNDNTIGGVYLNIWLDSLGYHYEFSAVDGLLSVKKVDKMEQGKKATLYKK